MPRYGDPEAGLTAYRYVVPDPVRERVHNVLSNIGSPVQIANDILKGKPRGAGDYCSIVMLKSTNFVTTAG